MAKHDIPIDEGIMDDYIHLGETEIDNTGEGKVETESEVIAGVVADVFEDTEEEIDFDWIKLNKKALKAVVSRVHGRVPKFMKLENITDPNELSLAKPSNQNKLLHYGKEFSWWGFIGEIVRDLFPEFTNKKYVVSRIVFAHFILKEVIVPIALSKNPELDIQGIEDGFNDLLIAKLKRQAQYKKNEF